MVVNTTEVHRFTRLAYDLHVSTHDTPVGTSVNQSVAFLPWVAKGEEGYAAAGDRVVWRLGGQW